MSTDKAGSPPCGIYMRIDDFSDMPKVITALRQVAMVVNRASGYEKNRVAVEFVYRVEHKDKIADLIDLVDSNGLVPVLSGAYTPDLAARADGVLCGSLDDAKAARATLGDDAIIGVACMTKDDMMHVIGEDVDYITAPTDPDLIQWFASKSSIVVAACGDDVTQDRCTALVLAGAGFVDSTHYILSHEKGVMQGAVNILHAIDLAVSLPKTLN